MPDTEPAARVHEYPNLGMSVAAAGQPAFHPTDHGLGPFELKSKTVVGEFVDEPKQPRQPAVRIVHHGGPARLATVYLNGHEADNATRAEIVLDASHHHGVHARIEFVGQPPIESTNVQLDVSAEAAELVETDPPRFFWPVLIGGLVVDAVAAGLAWWSWDRSGWFATLVSVLSVMGGLVWTFGVLAGFVGYGRAMAEADPAGPEDVEDEQ